MNTLSAILDKLKQIDDDLNPEDFKPEEVVGDLKDKVDAIKWRIDTWNAEADALDAWVEQLKRRKESMLKKSDRLKEYVVSEMQKHGYETLPGEMVRVDLRKAQPSLKIDTVADATAYLLYPGFVVQKTSYMWDKTRIKESIEGESLELFNTLGLKVPACSLEPSSYIKFEVRKEKKK